MDYYVIESLIQMELGDDADDKILHEYTILT
jgi:hypothetical protein